MAAPWVLFISVVCFSGITAVAPATVICCIARSKYFSYELLQRVLDCACRAQTADCCYLPNHACSCVTTTDPSVAPTTDGAICCVATRDLSDKLLQHALEYVCRVRADCCDLNNNVRNHPSYTSSCSNKNKTRAPPPASCSDIGTAAVTTDPCYVICIYPSSPTSNTPPARTYTPPPTTPPAPAPAPAPSTPPTTMIVATPPTSNTAHAPPLAAPPTSRNGLVNTQENSAASLHSLAAPSHILFLLLFFQFIFI